MTDKGTGWLKSPGRREWMSARPKGCGALVPTLSILDKYSLSSRPILSFQRRANRREAPGREYQTLWQLGRAVEFLDAADFLTAAGGVALS